MSAPVPQTLTITDDDDTPVVTLALSPTVMHRPPARALAGVLAPVAECRRQIRSGTTAIPDRVPIHYRALSRGVDSVTDAHHRSQRVPASVGVESRRWSGRRRGSVSVSRTRPRTRSCARRPVVEGGGGGAIRTADELALRERPGALGANSRRAGGAPRRGRAKARAARSRRCGVQRGIPSSGIAVSLWTTIHLEP